jgi:hypothetical protein
MIFNSVWSLLVLAYVGITPIYMTGIFHKLAALVLNVITTIFWFAGSIALAVAVGGPWTCGADRVCGSYEAAIAFGFFLWYVLSPYTDLSFSTRTLTPHSQGSIHGSHRRRCSRVPPQPRT